MSKTTKKGKNERKITTGQEGNEFINHAGRGNFSHSK